jgi:hypothetical protein
LVWVPDLRQLPAPAAPALRGSWQIFHRIDTRPPTTLDRVEPHCGRDDDAGSEFHLGLDSSADEWYSARLRDSTDLSVGA